MSDGGADVIIEDERWNNLNISDICAICLATVCDVLELNNAHEVAILATNDAKMAVLNAEFRGKDAATNVLSWPSEDRGIAAPGATPSAPQFVELGDLALGLETCVREADQGKITLHDHVTHLVIHGLLHLLGYDHERDEDATLMEELEVMALEKLGVDNPY